MTDAQADRAGFRAVNTNTIPDSILDQVRPADAMCTCGHTANDHANRFGPCCGHHPGMVACSCERWTWSPDDDPRVRQRNVEQARAIMADLRGRMRRAALGLTARPGELTRMRLIALGLWNDDAPTSLGREILRGWTCERCDGWHPEGEEHYSAEHCNDTGTDVQLCQPCAAKADAEGPRA